MSGKRGKLDLAAVAKPKPDPVATAVAEHEAPAAPAVKEKPAPVHTARLNVPVTPEARRAFNMLKAETGKQGPELMTEALNLLLATYGKEEL